MWPEQKRYPENAKYKKQTPQQTPQQTPHRNNI